MTFFYTILFLNALCLICNANIEMNDGSGCRQDSDDDDCRNDSGSGDLIQPEPEHNIASITQPLVNAYTKSISTTRMPSSSSSTSQRPNKVHILPTTTSPSINQLNGCSKRGQMAIDNDVFTPACHPQHPHLFLRKQCVGIGSDADCFCVNTESGLLIEQTRRSDSDIICEPALFNLTLGFAMTWNSQLLHNTTAEFADLAKRVEVAVEEVYGNKGRYVGRRTAKVQAFTAGSVVAHILLTSVGHNSKPATLHRILKGPFDAVVSENNLKYFINKLLPYNYRFTAADSQEVVLFDSGKLGPKNMLSVKNQISATADSSHSDLDLKSKNLGVVLEGVGDLNLEDNRKAQLESNMAALEPILLAVVIIGVVTLIIILVLVVLYCFQRARKADGSRYVLDAHSKKAQIITSNVYHRAPAQEFYA